MIVRLGGALNSLVAVALPARHRCIVKAIEAGKAKAQNRILDPKTVAEAESFVAISHQN